MTALTRQPLHLSPHQRQSLAQALPWPASRTAPDTPLETEVLLQPWFQNHRIVEVRSPLPHPPLQAHLALAPDDAWLLLTGHLETLNHLARRDPPSLQTDQEALRYANLVDWWTTESRLGELLLDSFQEIPWLRPLSPEQRAYVRHLEDRFAAQIHPLRIERQEGAWGVTKWLLSAARLLRRTLTVTPQGQLSRQDEVLAEDLPCPRGEFWGFVDGRLVPIG